MTSRGTNAADWTSERRESVVISTGVVNFVREGMVAVLFGYWLVFSSTEPQIYSIATGKAKRKRHRVLIHVGMRVESVAARF